MKLHRPTGTVASGQDPVSLTPEEAGWSYSGLQVMRLRPSESRTVLLGDEEALVVPLTGSCVIDWPGGSFTLTGRRRLFSGPTDVCFLPRATPLSLISESGGEFAVATARTDRDGPVLFRPAAQVPVELRGAGRATRQIHQLLGAQVDGPSRLIVVEVLTPSGNWSSHPPHKHDELTLDECPLEEIYYFRFDRPGAFGLHRTYTIDGSIDETATVIDGDVFLVPRGYHGPSAAPPGYWMYYLNVMAGPGPRAWKVCNDPSHAWLWEEWQTQPLDPRLPIKETH